MQRGFKKHLNSFGTPKEPLCITVTIPVTLQSSQMLLVATLVGTITILGPAVRLSRLCPDGLWMKTCEMWSSLIWFYVPGWNDEGNGDPGITHHKGKQRLIYLPGMRTAAASCSYWCLVIGGLRSLWGRATYICALVQKAFKCLFVGTGDSGMNKVQALFSRST